MDIQWISSPILHARMRPVTPLLTPLFSKRLVSWAPTHVGRWGGGGNLTITTIDFEQSARPVTPLLTPLFSKRLVSWAPTHVGRWGGGGNLTITTIDFEQSFIVLQKVRPCESHNKDLPSKQFFELRAIPMPCFGVSINNVVGNLEQKTNHSGKL